MFEEHLRVEEFTDGSRTVLSEDGEVLPITHIFYVDDEPVSLVAGPRADGKWLTLDMNDLTPVVMH